MQNCDEVLPILDFRHLEEWETEALLYLISEACEVLASSTPLTIRIIKSDSSN